MYKKVKENINNPQLTHTAYPQQSLDGCFDDNA